jgi:hypothetical protein
LSEASVVRRIHRYLLFPVLLLALTSCFSRNDLLDLARTAPQPDETIIYGNLAVIGAQATSNTGVRVYFSEDVEQTGAETAGNYLIPGLSVLAASRDPSDHSIVQLDTSAQSGVTYSLTVQKVRDLTQLPIGFNNVVIFTGDAAPYLQSAGSYSNTEVRIYFSESVEQASASNAANYTIVPGLTVVSASRDAVDFSQVNLETGSQGDGTSYTVTVTGVRDLNGNTLTSPNAKTFSGTGVVDTTPPQLLAASMVSADTVELRFSEPLDQASAESGANYSITDIDSNSIPVSAAVLQADPSKVWVEVSDYFTRGGYSVTVDTAVQDLSGNVLVGPPDNQVSFAGLGTVIADAKATSPTGVRVYFSTEVELSKAQNKNNYAIPGLTVTGASRDPADYSIVDLVTTAQSDIDYTLTVFNVIDQDAKAFSGDVPPSLKSVTSSGNTAVTVYFSEAVDEASAEDPANYYIVALAVSSATRDPSDLSKVTLQTGLQSGSILYTLEVTGVRDLNLNPIASPGSLQFPGTGLSDMNRPDLLAAELVDGNTVCAIFSEPVDQGSAETLSYYAIEDSLGGGVSVIAAALQPDASKVWLDVSGALSGSLYTVTVTGVKDLSGNLLLGPPENRVCFAGAGTPPQSFYEGPLVTDPFGESTNTFCLLATYRERVYCGPAEGDNVVLRMKPDGTDPELATLVFRASSTITYTLDPGPDGETGIDCIEGGFINGEEYLFVGPARSGGNLGFIYYTKESGTTLHFEAMDLSPVLGPQTKGVSSMVVFNDSLYLGFPDDGGKRPYLVKVLNVKKDPVEGTDVVNLDGDMMPRIGTNGSPKNSGGKVGIDSFGIHNDCLYLGNGGKTEPDADGGIVRSTTNDPKAFSTAPGDWEDVTQVGAVHWYSGLDRFSLEINDVNQLTPAQKAFPAMVSFNGSLYVIRNSTSSLGGPQLWRYDGGAWMLIADNGTGLTNMGDLNNKKATLLVVNGDRLYIGFDNPVNGAQVWRTSPGVNDPLIEGDFEAVTTDGLGDPANNQKIYHAFSAADTTLHYLWLLCGRDGSDLRVFRTDNS